MTYLYIPCLELGFGETSLVWSAYSTVENAKEVVEKIDDNIDPDRWWLDNEEFELWRNGDYYIDRVVLDEFPSLLKGSEATDGE